MKEYTCIICRERMSAWNAMRLGGVAEELLGRCFVCRRCASDGVDLKKLAEAVKHDG